MYFGFNSQFIKVNRTLAKILKTTKNLFCLSFSIQDTTLHVIRIPNIKFFFSNPRTVRFYPIKIKNLLIKEGFSWTLHKPTIRNHNKTLDFIRQQNNAAYLK